MVPLRPRSLTGWIIVLLLALGLTAPAAAENRQALLIANGRYQSFPSLGTPVAEAQALATALKKLGFTVNLVTDAGRETMLDALEAFERSLQGKGGVALFHYGGHGVQVAGKNYLLPVDADIPDERRVATRAVDVEEVMATLTGSGADTSLVILDACRNNPLPGASSRSVARGLSAVANRPKNSLVVYSAEAGSTAQDGLFTPALTRALGIPGLSLTDTLALVRKEVYERSGGSQIPGEYSQLFAPVYLTPAETVPWITDQRWSVKDGAATYNGDKADSVAWWGKRLTGDGTVTFDILFENPGQRTSEWEILPLLYGNGRQDPSFWVGGVSVNYYPDNPGTVASMVRTNGIYEGVRFHAGTAVLPRLDFSVVHHCRLVFLKGRLSFFVDGLVVQDSVPVPGVVQDGYFGLGHYQLLGLKFTVSRVVWTPAVGG